MTAFLMLSFFPTQLKAETEKSASTAVTTKTVESTDANATTEARYDKELARLDEIKAMDLSTLTPAEKKELREEVRSIQNGQEDHDRNRDRDRDHEGYHHHHGVFLPIGGGLLIIILLILLL